MDKIENTSNNEFHILNGDALKAYLSDELKGTIIIMREALSSGPLGSYGSDNFHMDRAKYLDVSLKEYQQHVVSQLNLIQDIKQNDIIYLWFEQDLFCQMNLWYVLTLLPKDSTNIRLVTTDQLHPYSLTSYSLSDLKLKQRNASNILHLDEWKVLWTSLCVADYDSFNEVSIELAKRYQWALIAFNIINLGNRNLPFYYVEKLLNQNTATPFKDVFLRFMKDHPEYGFGDMQIRSIYNAIK